MGINNLEIRATTAGPGVLIKGDDRPSEVFDCINSLLYEFYEKKGLLFVPQHEKMRDAKTGNSVTAAVEFNGSRRGYSHKVYIGDMSEIRSGQVEKPGGLDYTSEEIKPPQMHGSIKVLYLGTEQHIKYVKKWDFPHAPAKWKTENFLAYFNLAIPEASREERDDFLEHARRVSRMH